jgi:hypothetical protein
MGPSPIASAASPASPIAAGPSPAPSLAVVASFDASLDASGQLSANGQSSSW